VVTDYIDQPCRKEGEKERNDGSFIGMEEKADGQGRERKVVICGKVKRLVDLIVRVLHGG